MVLLETSLEVALLDQFESVRVAGATMQVRCGNSLGNEYITCPHDSNRTAPVFALPILATAGPAADAVAYAGSTITFVLTGVRE